MGKTRGQEGGKNMLEQLGAMKPETDPAAMVVISVGVLLFFGFGMTRLTKKLHLPNVTAYLLTGIFVGPHCLNLIPETVMEGTVFLPDLSLSFIAFGTGEFFKGSALQENGRKAVVIGILDALVTGGMVFGVARCFLKLELFFALILAALAATVSPTSTVMTIRQTGAKGDFVDTLLQVVAFDDVIGLLVFGVVTAMAAVFYGGGAALGLGNVLWPLLINLVVILLGGVCGLLLKALLPESRTQENRLIILVSLLCAFSGMCVMLDVSPLLGCMSMGMVYVNITGDGDLFRQLSGFTPPILLLFFVRSGLTFRLDTILKPSGTVGTVSLLMVGVIYCAVRVCGKYVGSFFGCVLTRKENRVRNFLGLALMPQASVAIGLATLGERALGGESGAALVSVILTSSILYELVGPACAKLALYRSGAYEEETSASAEEEKEKV